LLPCSPFVRTSTPGPSVFIKFCKLFTCDRSTLPFGSFCGRWSLTVERGGTTRRFS
ncbi:unnamed protein product, partial [Acanthoscelides obtectus]